MPPYRLPWLLLLVLLAGCATVPLGSKVVSEVDCRTLFRQVDAAIIAGGVRDHGATPMPGFPYLRSNRLLASFRAELGTPARFSAWIHRLGQLDARARAIELRNLQRTVNGMQDDTLLARLGACRDRLLASEGNDPGIRRQLIDAARVPDDYRTWWRILGLYPVTALIVAEGIDDWHRESARVFATPLHELPIHGSLQRWGLSAGTSIAAEEVRAMIEGSRDALGIPQPDQEQQQRLFSAFAPIWEVDVVSHDDRIGTPYWDDGPRIDTAHPRLYTRLSHTRLAGTTLLQLNFIIWFPARPGNDIYSGRLDGINWRITLGPDGTPWLYDSIHNCGCYHMLFPGPRLQLRSRVSSPYDERPLMAQPAPPGQPVVVRVASRTHFIERIYRDDHPRVAQSVTTAPYDGLRSLPSAGEHRNLFGAHGIITASARPERFLLWPMGIRSPGAMRQWGRHATAFLGRRHFDDPDLIESLFEVLPP